MPRANETRSAHLVRELQAFTSRMRGLNIHTQEEADAWQQAVRELDMHIQIAIRMRETREGALTDA